MADTAHNYGDKNRNIMLPFNDFNRLTNKMMKEDIDTSFTSTAVAWESSL